MSDIHERAGAMIAVGACLAAFVVALVVAARAEWKHLASEDVEREGF